MMDYQNLLSGNVKSLRPSGIRKFFDILEEMDDAISLGIGEPDFVTPWHIRDAGIFSLEKGFTKYTGNAGLTRLRKEISAYLKRRFNLEYSYKDQIIVTVGGSEAIDLTIRALINPGDEVIIPIPSFVCYGPITTLANGKPVYVETKVENEFPPDGGSAARRHTRRQSLCPSVPVQPYRRHLWRDEDLEAIADVLRAPILSFCRTRSTPSLLTDSGTCRWQTYPDMAERTIVVNVAFPRATR
jgi:aminotransferase